MAEVERPRQVLRPTCPTPRRTPVGPEPSPAMSSSPVPPPSELRRERGMAAGRPRDISALSTSTDGCSCKGQRTHAMQRVLQQLRTDSDPRCPTARDQADLPLLVRPAPLERELRDDAKR